MLKMNKKLTMVLISLVVLVTLCITTAFSLYIYALVNQIEVTVIDSEASQTFKTTSKTTDEILTEKGYILNGKDCVDPAPDFIVRQNATITIMREHPVTIVADGLEFVTTSAGSTPEEILHSEEIEFNENDKIITEVIDEAAKHLKIELIRVTQEEFIKKEALSFETRRKEDASMPRGSTKIIQKGKKGSAERTYLRTLENGVEVCTELIMEKVTLSPVDQIMEYGTLEPRTVLSSRGDSLRVKKVIDVVATAYDLSYESCGKRPGDRGYGITASGMQAQYGVIAVDPKVIPLNTKLYIEAPDGSWVYGRAVAGDTGGSIKGNRIDLFFDSKSEAIQFGRKTAKVYILE